jgi:hypothetical protein
MNMFYMQFEFDFKFDLWFTICFIFNLSDVFYFNNRFTFASYIESNLNP